MNLKFGRTATLIAFGVGITVLLGWLVTSQGPLAPVKVTVAKVAQGTLVARTFGIGTVEARRSYALGPTLASRVMRVLVDQGDTVKAGQLVAELDPVDLTDRVTSGELAAERAASAIRAAQAQLVEAQSRAQIAMSVARRYADLRAQGFVSQEAADAKAHEANAAKAGVDAATAQVAVARRDHERAQADVAGIGKLRTQARLVARSMGWSARGWSNPARQSSLARRCCRSSTQPLCGSRRASIRASPEEFAWASPPRSCCAPIPNAPTAERYSASIG